MFRFNCFFVSGFVVSLLYGCGEVLNSNKIDTGDIYVDYSVDVVDDNVAVIDATLLLHNKKSYKYIRLVDGDDLVVSLNGGETQVLVRSTGLFNESKKYSLQIEEEGAGLEGAEYKIQLVRTKYQAALESVAFVPAAYTGLIADRESFSRTQEPLTLTWDGLDYTRRIPLAFSGECITNNEIKTADSGIYIVNTGFFYDQNASCDITFDLKSYADGEVDEVLVYGSEFKVTNHTRLVVPSTP